MQTSRNIMPVQVSHPDNIQGLSNLQIQALSKQYGKNVFRTESSRNVFHIIRDIIIEPMFILLAIACSLYFILGEIN
jgi:Ca2+-transporting ATPase